MKLVFWPFYTCDERWALHVVIKREFFLHLLKCISHRFKTAIMRIFTVRYKESLEQAFTFVSDDWMI